MSSSSSTFTSFSSTSYSSSSSSNGQQTSGHRAAQQSYTDPSGQTYVKQAAQNLGEPAMMETKQYDAQGNQMLEGGVGGAGRLQSGGDDRRIEDRITDVSGEETAKERAEREYMERMEEEYAKREGGA